MRFLGAAALALLLASPAAADAPCAGRAERASEAAAFAASLAKEGDDYRAIGQYKYALFLNPSSPDADLWRLAIGEAYRAGEQYVEAGKTFDAVAREGGRARAQAYLGAAKSWLSAGKFETAAARARAAARAYAGNADRVREAEYLEGWALVRDGQDAAAARAFEAARGPGAVGQGATRLVAVLPQLAHLPSKSPVLAGLLGVVPGLGHLYLGDPATALSAFVWNGVFGWALYDAVRARSWSLAVVLALFESMWYGGSIVGAISGAHRFNRDARLNAMEDLARIAPPSLVDQEARPAVP